MVKSSVTSAVYTIKKLLHSNLFYGKVTAGLKKKKKIILKCEIKARATQRDLQCKAQHHTHSHKLDRNNNNYQGIVSKSQNN